MNRICLLRTGVVFVCVVLLTSSCGGIQAGVSDEAEAPFPITILTAEYSGNPAGPDNKLFRMLEESTNTRLDIQWVPNASYTDKMNITLASGNLPMLMKVENTRIPSVANAIAGGAFWELGPYLKDYPNLSQADPNIIKSTSVNGKMYGVYRSRAEGRIGISYRKDWLDKLGLKEPSTIEEFYRVLYAFTYGDPDGNGKQDTYGLAVSKYNLPWDVMQVWFGAPNRWGEDASGRLLPDFMTEEYAAALHFFHRLYEEKLVNADFPIYDPDRWNEQFLNGRAGVMIDVADTAGRLESAMAKTNPSAVVGVMGGVSGPKGLRILPTSGYNGIYLISKSGVKTEEDLRRVLQFLDRLNDEDLQRLLSYGIEGIHYAVKDGRLAVFDSSRIPQDARLNDLAQLLMMIPDRATTMFKPSTVLRERIRQIMESNAKSLIRNPAEALGSETYKLKGTMLDRMIEDARIRFITGKIDEAGWKEAVQAWRKNGGDSYIKELNASAGSEPPAASGNGGESR